MLGSFPPRERGIATFAKDVVHNLTIYATVGRHVIALDAPNARFQPTTHAKVKLGIGDRMLIATFGLLSRGKGDPCAHEQLALGRRLLCGFRCARCIAAGVTGCSIARSGATRWSVARIDMAVI